MHCFYSLSQKTLCCGGSGAESSEITLRLLPQTHPWGYFRLVELLGVWTIPEKGRTECCDKGIVLLTCFILSLGVISCHILGLEAGERAGRVGAPQRRK